MVPFLLIKHRLLSPHSPPEKIKTVGIFHLPCHAQGGGEKVLWAMVNSLVRADYDVTVYCTILQDKEALMKTIRKNFGYDLNLSQFKILEMDSAYLPLGTVWPFMHRFFHVLSMAAVGFEAVNLHMPDLFIESWTAHFALYPVKMLNPYATLYTYVHQVWTSPAVMDGFFERWNQIEFGTEKLTYGYELLHHWIVDIAFAKLTNVFDECLPNSSDTKRKIELMWGKDRCVILYPPCNIEEFYFDDYSKKTRTVISVAQFRWEKRQDVQLDAIAYHQKMHPESTFKFQIIGNARAMESKQILSNLEKKIKDLNIKNTELVLDLTIPQLKEHIANAGLGFHTTTIEAFGIAIAEMVAGGIYILAHNSAGPRSDILGHGGKPLYGELFDTDQEFYERLDKLLEEYDNPVKRAEFEAKVKAGQKNAKDNLSEAAFSRNLIGLVHKSDTNLEKYHSTSEQASKSQKGKKSASKAHGDL